MRQAFWVFTLASSVVVASPGDAVRAGSGPKDAIAQAREQIAKKNPKAAASVLEDALGDSRGDDREAILGLLKQSYKSLISEAQAAGRTDEAALYADDLAILEAPTGNGSAPAPPRDAPAPPVVVAGTSPPRIEPTPVPEPAKPPIIPDVPSTPAPAPKPEPQDAPSIALPRSDKSVARVGLDVPDSPPAADSSPPLDSLNAGDSAPASPTLAAPGKIAPAPKRAVSPPPSQAAAEEIPPITAAPKPTRDDSVRTASNSAGASRAEGGGPTPTISAGKNLGAADALFTQKKYEEAGKIYAELAAQGSLPSVRKKVWAYCRWAAVVARVNAHPRTAKEWDEIEKELQNIQVLTPGNWYGEYIRDRVSAARRGEQPSKRSGGLVVRGAAPEEPEESLDLPSAAEPPASLPTPDEVESESGPGPAAAISTATAPNWQIHETASFRIFHADPALAEQAAEAAEAVRARQGTRWGSKAVQGPWSPRCDVYLYPTARDFARMTGQPETSPGFSTMGVSGGRIVTRRVNLRADHPQLLSAILPHEVTHVVLADVFSDQQIPRWADEGMAVLAEPDAEQAGRAADLTGPLAEQRLFKLGQLMSIDYPESRHWNLFYAQSVSLTQFLVRQGTASQFVAFIKNAQRNGPETAVREVYKFDGLDDLESRWRDYARRQASPIATVDAPSPADSPVTQ